MSGDGIPEVFCDKVESVEVIGPCARIKLTAGPDNMPPEERQAALYVVFPIERIPSAILFMAQWLAEHTRDESVERAAATLIPLQ